MVGHIIHPFKPLKGVTFNVPLIWHSFSGGGYYDIATLDGFNISKDNGTFTSCTNTQTAVSGAVASGTGYLTLTADEMNADLIHVEILDGVVGWTYTIYTTPSELSSVPTIESSISEKITALWQYFFLKRSMSSSTMTMHKDDEVTTLCSSTVTDDGSTVVKGEFS